MDKSMEYKVFPLGIWIEIICSLDLKTLKMIPLLSRFFRDLCKNEIKLLKKKLIGFDFKSYKIEYKDMIWIRKKMLNFKTIMIGSIESLKKIYHPQKTTLIGNNMLFFENKEIIIDSDHKLAIINLDEIDIKLFTKYFTKTIEFDSSIYTINEYGLFLIKSIIPRDGTYVIKQCLLEYRIKGEPKSLGRKILKMNSNFKIDEY